MPVTLKMRLGWDDRSINAPELARRAQDAGVRLITVHGRTRCQFYKGRADWAAVRAVKDKRLDPGRRERRHPQLRGRRRRACGLRRRRGHDRPRRAGPSVAARADRPLPRRAAGAKARRRSQRNSTIIEQLYDEMLSHHGRAVGRRHARKHLGWALDAAAETAGASDALLKAHRARVLTADDPAAVRRHLADAYAAFAGGADRKAA